MKIHQNPLINAGARAMTKLFFVFFFFFFFFLFFFFLNGHSYLDLEPSNLKIKFARDIIITNIYVKIHQQDKIFRRKRLSTGANFVHVYTEILDKGILKFTKFFNVTGKKKTSNVNL